MNILFETTEWIVAVKPPDMISEQTGTAESFADLLAGQNHGYIGVIHRLDRGVGGVMIYAKTKTAAGWLSTAAQEHRLGKEYLAILEGIPEENAGELQDLLYYDRSKNKVYPVSRQRKGVKEAVLTYQTVAVCPHPETGKPLTLVSVRPVTGRTHQIRVQFASRKLPLAGDRKYGGSGNGGISLWCRELRIPAHAQSPAQVCSQNPVGGLWEIFRSELDS